MRRRALRASRRLSHPVILVVCACVTATSVGLVAVTPASRSHSGGAHPRRGAISSRSGGLELPTLAKPLLGAQQMTLADAHAAVTFSFPVPSSMAAGPGDLSNVWVNRAQEQVALVYGAGDITVIMSPAPYSDPATEFATFIEENNATATLGQVGGQVALVISPGTDIKQSNPAWVEFDLNGVDINVVSATEGTAALLGVANSIAQQASCATCAHASRSRHRPSSSRSRGRPSSWHKGIVVGVIHFVGGRFPGAGRYRPSPGVVRVFTSSGRVVASEYLHGWGHRFRFALVPGRYEFAVGGNAASRRSRDCPPKSVYVRPGSSAHVVLESGCSSGSTNTSP